MRHPFRPTLCMLPTAGVAGSLGPSVRLVPLPAPVQMPCQGTVPPAVSGSPTCFQTEVLNKGRCMHALLRACSGKYTIKTPFAVPRTVYQYLRHKCLRQGQPMQWPLPQHVDAEKLQSCHRLMHIPLATSVAMAPALWGSCTAWKEAQLIAHTPTCSASIISLFWSL